MAFKFNPITGQFDLVNTSSSNSGTVDFDTILSGPSNDLWGSDISNFESLFDEHGNILIGV